VISLLNSFTEPGGLFAGVPTELRIVFGPEWKPGHREWTLFRWSHSGPYFYDVDGYSSTFPKNHRVWSAIRAWHDQGCYVNKSGLCLYIEDSC
jgi:hypothetical protein